MGSSVANGHSYPGSPTPSTSLNRKVDRTRQFTPPYFIPSIPFVYIADITQWEQFALTGVLDCNVQLVCEGRERENFRNTRFLPEGNSEFGIGI